jgi:hypothetical protein
LPIIPSLRTQPESVHFSADFTAPGAECCAKSTFPTVQVDFDFLFYKIDQPGRLGV